MRRTSVSHLLVALTVVSLCGLGSAQDNSSGVPQGKYVVMPPHLRDDVPVPATSLQTWNGSFTYSGSNYGYNMVGTAPSSNSSTTIPVYIIPVKIVISSRRGSTTFDPHTFSPTEIR